MIDLDVPADEVYAQLIGISEDDFRELMADAETNRRVVDVLIEHMCERLRPERAEGVDAVLHVKLWDRPGGGYDHREMIIRDGRCRVSERPSEEPRLTLKVRPIDLRAMITGKTGPRRLAFSGRLRVIGDIRFAWSITDLFDLSPDT